MEAYRTPDDRFEDLAGWPYAPRYLEQDGLRMHYVDEGEGDPVLLLHGEPTWGFLYRRMIPTLAKAGRVLDHIETARARGQAVILITHNFRHALSVADDITVLAQGRAIGHFRRDEIELDDLTELVARVA